VGVQKEWFENDYYEVLGVEPTADAKDITKAYRALAKKYHPDANGNDPEAAEKFKEVTNAYEVIGDDENRKEYDYIKMMSAENASAPPGGFGFSFRTTNPQYGDASAQDSEDLSDLLSGLFSRVRKPTGHQQASQPGPAPQQSFDLETQVALTFYQALEGSVTKVTYRDPTKPQEQEVKVKIPAGVNDGQRIKVSGKGLSTPQGTGNLYVVVSVGTHPWFSRKGRTLSITVPVSYPESVLGTQVKVPTLGDPVTVKVPPGTTSGKTLRVKGRGCDIAGEQGDLLITFDVVTPENVSDQEKELLQQLIDLQSDHPRAKFGLEQS
jgi:molecular chaperone DnaJ